MVLEMRYKGRNIKPGDRVLKSSKIDLVLGDGKESYVEEVDTTATPTTEQLPNEQ
jgi:hypothetical protein